MAIVDNMYMKIMIFLTFLFGFGYFHRTKAWRALHESQCPVENPETHECYELIEEDRTCLAYAIDCCDYDEDDDVDHYNGYCRMCMKLVYRPCVWYMCTRKGCCEGWYKDHEGKCTIPENVPEVQCKNGGVRLENNTCSCPEIFTGIKCETLVCNPECENDGRCELVNETPTCVCPSKHFKGNYCEEVTCEHECLNGGHCFKNGVIASCQCTEGYRGPGCEVLTSGMCPIMPNDLNSWECSGGDYECMSDEDCLEGRVCCWNGCAGVCQKPETATCHFNNQTFLVGDVYKPHACAVCVCQPLGEMACKDMICENLECPGGHIPLAVEGQCCKRCPGTDPPTLPPEPMFINCPSHYVEANVESYNNVAKLPDLSLRAEDYANFELSVMYSQTRFVHSGKTDIRTNTHIIVAYSDADRYGRRGSCKIKVIVRDKYSPKFSSCPYDQWLEDYETVTWQPPVPSDNVGIFRLTAVGDECLNKTLPPGAHTVSYMALDFDQNHAVCSFMIHVYKSNSAYDNYYQQDFPSGTVVGITTGFILVIFFTIWVYARVRQNPKSGDTEGATDSSTIASTADGGVNSSVYTMCGNMANIHNNINDITMKDIKLPEYSPPTHPPAYEELPKTGDSWGQSASLPIYEEIHENEGIPKKLEPQYENVNSRVENDNGRDTHYENVANGTQNPAYMNAPE